MSQFIREYSFHNCIIRFECLLLDFILIYPFFFMDFVLMKALIDFILMDALVDFILIDTLVTAVLEEPFIDTLLNLEGVITTEDPISTYFITFVLFQPLF